MQTFLTSTNPNPLRAAQETFQMLDKPRLNKQRSEVKQLLAAQFPNHPAHHMWMGHEHALTAYGIIACKMWIRRGGGDAADLLGEFSNKRQRFIAQDIALVWPWWYSHPAMVRTHQSKLYHKGSPRWVARTEETNNTRNAMRLPYLWPGHDEDTFFLSAAEAKRGDWEIPSSWSYDVKSRLVIPR